MNCWKCGAPLDQIVSKLSFRAECGQCHSWLHVCKNCKNYQPGLPNDCKVPGTDPIADRETINFCEEFQILGQAPTKKADPKDVIKKLFKDE